MSQVGGKVRVGISAGEPHAVRDTAEFLVAQTNTPFDLVRLTAAGALGFNELIADPAEAYVLLEAGVRVAPRWLELLHAALNRSGAGLAGPSTNRAWNEQSSVRATGSDVRAVRRDADAALRQFGRAARTLAPLYSLSDFCYLVHRPVIEVIGEADPGYAEGPCWEMDYNLRAARAGFAGLWVGGAYAWRPPGLTESPLLETNRRRYQDSFCGRRRVDPSRPYEPHCRGDACEDFAPEIGRPDPISITVSPRTPLVSCVMPTRDRPALARRAVDYFLAQDYPHTELIIVEDGNSGLAAGLPRDLRIRHQYAARPRSGGRPCSIGALRNQGCAAAGGELIVLWDDDDWHGPGRISHQVAPLLDGSADITGLFDLDWFDPAGWQSWRLSADLHAVMLRHDVFGGTLAFRRDLARRHSFPDRSLAEDADFLDCLIRGGSRLTRLSGQGQYVYVRHPGNSWTVRPATTTGWLRVPPPALSPADLDFYRSLIPGPLPDRPLVSAIMPTYQRRAYVGRSIDYFLRQDYGFAELVILDDGEDSVADLVPIDDRIRYHRLERRTVLGAKRNLACDLARGDLIAHWDDDDWQAAHRLSTQVERLTNTRADICGSGSLLFWDPRRERAWRYTWPASRRGWVAGASLCYPRSLWRRAPFPEIGVGEDTRFIWQSVVRKIADVRSEHCLIGLVHDHNTVTKTGCGTYWSPAGIPEVAACLGEDMKFYAEAVRQPRTHELRGADS